MKITSTSDTIDLLMAFFNADQQEQIRKKLNEASVDDVNEQVVYLRSQVINMLENECVHVFVENEQDILSGKFTGSLIDHIEPRQYEAYQACVRHSYANIYHSRDVVDIELAGFKVMTTLTQLMVDAVTHPNRAYSELLMNRVSRQYQIRAPRLYDRLLAVLDYISGMTDVYALDLYQSLVGMSLPKI